MQLAKYYVLLISIVFGALFSLLGYQYYFDYEYKWPQLILLMVPIGVLMNVERNNEIKLMRSIVYTGIFCSFMLAILYVYYDIYKEVVGFYSNYHTAFFIASMLSLLAYVVLKASPKLGSLNNGAGFRIRDTLLLLGCCTVASFLLKVITVTVSPYNSIMGVFVRFADTFWVVWSTSLGPILIGASTMYFSFEWLQRKLVNRK